jgi:prepilin-type processing-associated H-X9-DG protein
MNHIQQNRFAAARTQRSQAMGAFTLVELLVVVLLVAMLAALLIPALAGAKGDNYRLWCQSNEKRIGTGFRLYENDHGDMFPPAAMHGAAKGSYRVTQLSWDSYIHRYIGGTVADQDLIGGVLSPDVTPKLLVCPADHVPPGWNYNSATGQSLYGLRSYSMVGTFTYLQIDPVMPGKPIYDVSNGTALGVGVYWSSTKIPADWDAGSFKASVVRDPGGTLLLVEMSENDNVAGYEWPCVSLAVQNPNYGAMLCQVDPNATMPAPGSSGVGVNLGKFLYLNHGQRFNYLFHDGHVETLTTNATIGTGTLQAPKGMWTVALGD